MNTLFPVRMSELLLSDLEQSTPEILRMTAEIRGLTPVCSGSPNCSPSLSGHEAQPVSLSGANSDACDGVTTHRREEQRYAAEHHAVSRTNSCMETHEQLKSNILVKGRRQ